jgi:3-deoxy-manno-octulosonate cytidylyltransferase (CMP-KDO synthetase)
MIAAHLDNNKYCVIIPARLNSSRFPGKVMWKFRNMPMIEHVYQRTCLTFPAKHTYIASGDHEILNHMSSVGANVIISEKIHNNGTSRSAEAAFHLPYENIIIIQADEILLDPEHLSTLLNDMNKNIDHNFFNLVTSLSDRTELDDISIVKCIMEQDNAISFLFRKIEDIQEVPGKFNKVMGVLAFRKDYLHRLTKKPDSKLQKITSIEQFKILENGFNLRGVPVDYGYPSINNPEDIDIVKRLIEKSKIQKTILWEYENRK